jgi:hypothetical protein
MTQASGGGSSGAAGNAGNAGGAGQGGGNSGGNSGGEGFDIRGFVEGVGSELGSARNEAAHARNMAERSHQMLAKLKGVLSGEDEQQEEENPNAWFQDILIQLVEAEKNGQDLPITKKQLLQLKKLSDDNTDLKKAVHRLLELEKTINDPEYSQNNQAWTMLDTYVSESIEKLYGEDDGTIAKAVTDKIVTSLKKLTRDNPQAWKQIRRNPTALRQFAVAHINQIIPKAHRHLLEEEHERSQPITEETIKQAWEECQRIEDPQQRAAMEAQVRQAFLELKFSKRR